MPGMLRLRSALTSVVNSRSGSCSQQAQKPPQNPPLAPSPSSPGEEDFFVGVDNLPNQEEPQQELYQHLSSQISEAGSAPSILFQSTTDSSGISHESDSSSSIQSPPSLSDLYHNPYEPMSFVKRNIQMSDTDSRAMITAKSNYTASSHTEGSGGDDHDDEYLHRHPIHSIISEHESPPASIIQVPEMMLRPVTPSMTPSSGGTITTANTSESSFSSSIPSPPQKSRPMLPLSMVQQQLPPPLEAEKQETSSSQKSTPSKKYGGSPWRIPRDTDSFAPKEQISPLGPTKQMSPEEEIAAHPISPSPPLTPARQPQRKESDPTPAEKELTNKMEEEAPSIQNTRSQAPLDSMARLQELEQKRQALRHQRFSLEQKLYDFCASKQQSRNLAASEPQQPSAETPKEQPKDDIGIMSSTAKSARRPLPFVKRPWRAPKHQGKSKDNSKSDTVVEVKPEQTTDSMDGRMVVDYIYNTEGLAIDQVDANGQKIKKKKPLKIIYTGRLNAKGQPHGDDATMQFCDGQVYSGSVRNGLRCGVGHNTWADGQEYKGEWLNNSRNGRGTHSWKDGRTVTGDWKNGHLHGKIYFSWPNGATFDGHAENGKKHGRGVHRYANGTVFNGNFLNGKPNGFGTLTERDGVKYRGQFRNGVKEGYGLMLWKTRTYDGEWLQDKPHGQGRVVWSNGAIYTGHFESGKYHGLGVYQYPNGKKFVGRWSAGLKHGRGLYQWPNGMKYDGEYVNGLREGYGRLVFVDGSTYCGGFKRNKRWGRGVQTDSSGAVVHCGMWKDDKPCVAGEPDVREPNTLALTDADRVMTSTLWPVQSPDKENGNRIPHAVTPSSPKSSHHTMATAAIVTPDEKHDISSPFSRAEDDDDDTSSGYILTSQQYLRPQRSVDCHIPICITDLE